MITGGFPGLWSSGAGEILALLPQSRVSLYLFGGIAVLLLLFSLLFVIVAMLEKQHLTGDVEPASEPYPYPPSPYWQTTREVAFQIGLSHAGDFATRRDKSVVKGLQSMFISPDHLVLVSIVSGSFAGAKLKKTVLRSKFPNGRVIESTDNPGTGDLSGVIQRELLLNAGIPELFDFHQRRLNLAGPGLIPFNPASVLSEYENIDLEKGGRWVVMGFARWVNLEQTCIRLTFRGALSLLKLNHSRELSRATSQMERSSIPRAGS